MELKKKIRSKTSVSKIPIPEKDSERKSLPFTPFIHTL